MLYRSAWLCVVLLACGAAHAQATRHSVDIGVAYDFNGDAEVGDYSGGGVPAGASLDIGNRTALLLAYEWHPTPNLGLQVSASLGGSIDISGAGSVASVGPIGKADANAVSVFANWHFFDAGNALRPFLGIGVNYTNYSGFTSYLGGSGSLGSSWGPAAQAGVRYAIDRNWSIVGTLGLAWVKSDLAMADAGGSQQARIDVKPVVLTLAAGYSF
jgi:outer membrane protein